MIAGYLECFSNYSGNYLIINYLTRLMEIVLSKQFQDQGPLSDGRLRLLLAGSSFSLQAAERQGSNPHGLVVVLGWPKT